LECFGRLATDIGESDLGRRIWSILVAWPQIWAKVVSAGPFGAFWAPGRRYGRKWPQEAHLEHFGRLAADMGESGRRVLIWSIIGCLAADMDESGLRKLI